MKTLITNFSRTKTLVITFCLFAILCILSNTIFQGDFTYLTQTNGYSAEQVIALLSSIGTSGRTIHVAILLADIAMVVLYTIFLLGICYRLSLKLTNNCHLITTLTFLPLLLSVDHLTEIFVLFFVLLGYPDVHVNVVNLSSTLTSIKFLLTPIIFFFPIVILSVTLLIKYKKGRIHNEG